MKLSVKKIVLFMVVMMVALCAYSQESESENDLFYINVPIINVYDHIDAYVVTYARGSIDSENVYLPKTWFKTSEAEKCRVRPLLKGMTPYMTVVYVNGTITKVYLNMPTNRRESCWKVLSRNIDVSSKLPGSPSELSFKF